MRIDAYSTLIALILLLVVSLSGCLQKEPENLVAPASPGGNMDSGKMDARNAAFSAEAEFKVGIIQSLTGDLGLGGAPMTDSIELAADEINANGGVLGRPIKLLIEDDQTLSVAAVDACQKLVNVERVPVIIGATGSGPSISILDISTKNGVLQISSSNTGVEFTSYNDRDLYFRTAPSDALQGMAMARLAEEKGYRTASTIVVNNPYGRGFEEIFIRDFEARGGNVLESVRYDPTQTIFESEVKEAFSAKPDFVMLVSYPETGSQILKTAYSQGYLKDTPSLMSEATMNAKLAEMVGKDSSCRFIIRGFGGVAPDQNAGGAAYQAFRDKFAEEYGKEPELYCSNSYDATALVALAAEEAGRIEGTAIRDHLRSVANPPGIEVSSIGEALKLVREGKEINYQGASGNITFDERGDVTGSYRAWSIADNGSVLLGDEILI